MVKYKITLNRLEELLNNFENAKIGLIGDACLYGFWEADMTVSELSPESPHFPLPVQKERYSLGAAGNAALNIRALGAELYFISCISPNDWRGNIFKNIMAKENIDTSYLIESGDIITPAYIKPMKKGLSSVVCEEPRIEFANDKDFDVKLENRIIENLKALKGRIDLLLVCDCFLYGCMTYRVREVICSLGHSVKVIVDSKNRIDKYKNVTVKLNAADVEKLVGMNIFKGFLTENLKDAARNISGRTQCPVYITINNTDKNGAFYHNNVTTSFGMQNDCYVEALPDGLSADNDVFLSAVSVAAASGASGSEALEIGYLAQNSTGKTGKNSIIENYKKWVRL